MDYKKNYEKTEENYQKYDFTERKQNRETYNFERNTEISKPSELSRSPVRTPNYENLSERRKRLVS